MSQPSQDIAIPMDSALANAPSRIVIGTNDEVSREKLLQDLNLSTRLRERIEVRSTTEGSNRRFVITCPDYWAWDKVLQSACLLSNEYYVNPGLRSLSSPGSVEDQSPAELATPGSGLTPGPSTFATVLNTPAFSSSWSPQAGNSLQSPIWEVQGSPFPTQVNNIQETPQVFSEATPSIPTSSSVFHSSNGVFKREETSDDDRDFFAVAEGEEEYVQEWDGGNTDMMGDEEEEDGESSPSGGKSLRSNVKAEESLLTTIAELYHYPDPEANVPTPSITNINEEEEEESMTSDNTGRPDSDQEMTEEDETEAIVEEPITSGYEADHSESDAARSPQQRRQRTPHPRAALSPSDLPDTPPTTGNASIAEIDDPPANQSTTQGTNNVLGPLLDSKEDELTEDAAEPVMDGLINGLSGLSLAPPDDSEVQPGPSVQSGQITTLGDPPQDSPNTSAESDVLRGMMEQGFDGTLGVDYVKAVVPAGNGGCGFVEVTRE